MSNRLSKSRLDFNGGKDCHHQECRSGRKPHPDSEVLPRLESDDLVQRDVLASTFGLTNVGAALHPDTLPEASLVVTGRTYNRVEGGGTYGQYIAAVTPADGVGKGGRTLNVLQVEDSTRYRTNLGIVEVSGKPATVEVSVLLPDAKVAPKVTIPLAANEYRQFRVLQQLGVGTAYNARITIRVIDGDGRVTAYGSVIVSGSDIRSRAVAKRLEELMLREDAASLATTRQAGSRAARCPPEILRAAPQDKIF